MNPQKISILMSGIYISDARSYANRTVNEGMLIARGFKPPKILRLDENGPPRYSLNLQVHYPFVKKSSTIYFFKYSIITSGWYLIGARVSPEIDAKKDTYKYKVYILVDGKEVIWNLCSRLCRLLIPHYLKAGSTLQLALNAEPETFFGSPLLWAWLLFKS